MLRYTCTRIPTQLNFEFNDHETRFIFLEFTYSCLKGIELILKIVQVKLILIVLEIEDLEKIERPESECNAYMHSLCKKK